MSNEIEVHRVQRYTDGITILAQQRMSRTRNKVRVENNVKAKIAFFNQIGSTFMVEKTTRHTDTPLIEIPHRRRAVIMKFFHTADLVDEADLLQVLDDPSGPMGMTMASAAGRTIDTQLFGACFAAAKTGEDGTGSTAHPASHQIGAGGAGMTIAKILNAKAILDRSEVDMMQPRHAFTRAAQIQEMLNLTEISSADFNTVQALAKGDISSFCGFQFDRSELVNDDTTDTLCPFYVENSLLIAFGADIRGRASERDDKDYSHQIYYSMRVGATRMDETGVVRVNCLGIA